MADDNNQVTIGLKDVYQQVQGLEKSLGTALATLNLTMTSIKSHLEMIDSRNTAADQLHTGHGSRLTAMESLLLKAQPETRLADHEVRVRSLERFKYALLGALILVNALGVFIEYLLTKHGG